MHDGCMFPSRPAIRIRPLPTTASSVPALTPPRVSGSPALVERVMARLSRVLDPASGQDIVSGGRVVALDIGPEEAMLTLRIGTGHCDSAHHVAEEAFAVLRAELPDTDLYLRHVQATPCAPEPDAPL